MRLTLRTLLAWLDDTLQPTQVREIGGQVAESPFAQELTERIHRVTRQRRLSVPSSSGPDGTDPNVVASYLDNDLDPEPVAEYEKQCLTSDVKLAEVASVHQILSLLGQKVRVPAEAKSRMYQLVKGRETVRERSPGVRRAESPEPVTRPIQPWVDPDPIKRSWIERFGLVAAGLGLIMLSIFTASWSLRVPPSEPISIPLEKKDAAQAEAVVPAPAKEELHASTPTGGEDGDGAPADLPHAPGMEKSTDAGTGDVAHAAKSKEAVEPKATKTVSSPSGAAVPASVKVPAGSSGLAATDGGVLLRYNVDQREWERLTGATPVNRSDRLLCLSPFRATVTLGEFTLMMLGETEIRILSQSTDKLPAIELIQGRLLVRNPPAGSLKVGFADRSVTVELASSSSVVMERTARREYGRTVTQAPPLFIYCTQGEVTLPAGQKHESLAAPDVVYVDAAGAVKRSGIDLPSWTTETEPSPHELKLRERFIRMFHPGRPVLTEIVAASEDEDSDVRQLSILALKSLGDLSLLMPTLSRAGDAVTRKGALAAIRSYMGLGPDATNRVRDQLGEEFGDDTAAFVAKMLVGYTPDEAADPKIFERLVAALGPEQQSIGVRELALDTLKQLTGRDDGLGYDPDHAEGKGLSAWKDLQRQGKLRYSATRGKAK